MAKRHPTRRRMASDPRTEPDDAFVARVFVLSVWARKNSQTLILAAVALAVLAGGLLYYASYRADLQRQAISELEMAQQVAMFAPPEEAEAELNRYVERFGGTRYAIEARAILGRLQLEQGRPQQAILTLEQAPRPGRDPMTTQARTLLGRAYEEVGRWQDAERAYLSVADAAQLEFERRDALADAARVRTQAGNPGGAAELYRRILEGMGETDPEREYFEMRLAEVDHLALG